jgi:hypothetical protein
LTALPLKAAMWLAISCLTKFLFSGFQRSSKIISVPNVHKQGEHICCLYNTEAEQLAVAAEYLADGLREGERCLYVGQSRAAVQRFRTALGNVGIDGAEAARTGALVESLHADAHLADGHFDCERMLHLLNDAMESALNDGYKGLRACGDMSWLFDEWQGCEPIDRNPLADSLDVPPQHPREENHTNGVRSV